MKHKLLVALAFAFNMAVYSSQVEFYDINTLYGVNMREAASVCKDTDGFIWASTRTGILRLSEDGYHVYQLPYVTANIIFVKLVYGHGILVAFTNNGQIFRYDTIQDRFELVTDIRMPLNDNTLLSERVLVGADGSLLVGTSVGLYRYRKEGLAQLEENNFAVVHDLAWYSDQQFFVAEEKGLRVMDLKSREVTILYDYPEGESLKVTSLFPDESLNRMWVGTASDGLFYYDMEDHLLFRSSVKDFPRQPIQAIRANSDSTLLAGIDGQGIWELTRNGDQVLNVYKENADAPLSLKGDGVYDIFCDGQRVWVCTYNGGISFYDQHPANVTRIIHQINNLNSLNNNNVNRVIEDRRGKLWFATDNGVSCWDIKSDKWRTYFSNKHEHAQVFLSLCEDVRGNIWAGTYSSGVYVIDGNTGNELAHYSKENSLLDNNYIFDIFKDSEGDLWLGSPISDTFCYLEKEKRFKSYAYHATYSLTELSPGRMLLLCSNGLFLLDKQTGEADAILDDYLCCDALVVGEDIWVCTSGDGLLRVNMEERSVEAFTTEAGLPSNFLNSIVQAGDELWLGTENGLSKFNLKDKAILVYSSVSPYFNVSFNRGAGSKLSNGQLIWGTNNGAVMFGPDAVQFSLSEGRIFFQDLIIAGNSIRKTPSLVPDVPLDSLQQIFLDYNQNTLTLEFLSIGSTVASSRFSWKMEGIDKEWTLPIDYGILSYTNMPSGKYRLKIRMYDSSLSRLIDERVLDIRITPPFWASWWFRLLLVVFAGVTLFFVLRFYVGRLKQRHAEDKIRFFTNTAHDIRTSLTLINAPIEKLNRERNLSEEGHYYLDLATEQSRRLSFVATQLLDFQKVDVGKGQLFLIMVDIVALVRRRKSMFSAAAAKQNITVEFSFDKESYVTAIDELKIERAVDNLISNAIKYSHPGGKVEIKLVCGKERWTLEVKDYGLGISDHAKNKLFREFYRGDNRVNSKMVGSGIGLLLARNYVNMHGGEISLHSKVGVGSRFKFSIPYKEVADTPDGVISQPVEKEPVKVQYNYPETALPEKDNVSAKRANVLVVEDHDDLQDFLRISLSDQYEVSVAGNGVEAWEQIRKQLPDLVISDIMMPDMDGFELCRLLKSTYETSHIPIILLTALTEKTQQLHGLGLGADDYLTKPFDMVILSQRIQTIIRNRISVREKALKLISGKAEEPVFFNELNDQFVKKAVEVVRSNMDNTEFDKAAFASAMNVSTSLLYKKIKAFTDQSPVDFIKNIRLNYALELLQSGKYTVTEVSSMSGFSSIKYFSMSFKKHFGKTPSEV